MTSKNIIILILILSCNSLYGQNILEDLLQQITSDKAGKTYLFIQVDSGGVKIEGTVIIIPNVRVLLQN